MVWNIILFIVGLVLIIKGGDFFVDAAVWIAKAMRIPTFIIGATIVSVATTMPEMLVSAMAAAEGSTEMAIGNAVGSVTANTAMIMALPMIFMNVVCPRKQYMKQCLILMGTAGILCISCFAGMNEGVFPFVGAILLILVFGYFIFENIRSAKKEQEESSGEERAPIKKKELILNLLFFVLGVAGIVVGSRLMVDNATAIATELGVSEGIIGVTIMAVGTSLPELVTTITAIAKKESGLSIGNIIGANIIDLSLILPVCSLVSLKQLPVDRQSLLVNIPVCFGLTLIATLPIVIRKKGSKLLGFALLALYACYVAFLVFNEIYKFI